VLGLTYTDIFFQSIAAASATKTSATPKLRIDLTNASYYDDQATPKLAFDAGARKFYDADGTTLVADFDAFLLKNGTNTVFDWSNASDPSMSGYTFYIHADVEIKRDGSNASATFVHAGNSGLGGTVSFNDGDAKAHVVLLSGGIVYSWKIDTVEQLAL
jgi:hypothetical protein